MDESNDSEALQGQKILKHEHAINQLKHFEDKNKDYYIVYQKENQRMKRELKFNKVKILDRSNYAIAMHTEDEADNVRYYHGEEVILHEDEIIAIRIIDPEEYDFVVYTD